MVNKKKKKLRPEERSKALSFFLLAFPTVIILVLNMMIPQSWWAQILIAVYQFIILKQFIDRHYDLI
jgi:hypothetical protein